MSFAARARRLAEDAEIVVLERDAYVSFANCGLPYHLAGEIPDRRSLLLHTPQSLAASLNLDVRTGHEVIGLDLERQAVRVRERDGEREYEERYDALVLSTGAGPFVPPVPGVNLPAVRVLRNIPDVDTLRELVDGGARRAVVVGAGFIGLEAAEALRHRGLDVTLVELVQQVLPPLDPEMARDVELELRRHDVDVRLGTSLAAVHPATSSDGAHDAGSNAAGSNAAGSSTGGAAPAVVVELSDGSQVPADLVLLAVGVRPETTLAAAAGLTRNERGAIVVDENLLTSAPNVYAVGDAIEVVDAVTGAPAVVPLAGPANRQGRAAADHLFGRAGRRTPVLGTAIVRVFDTVAATTGRPQKALTAAGIAHHAVHLHPGHHAGYYPGARPLHLKLLFAPDGRILGAQATGSEGVDKRIDVIATAIRAGMTVHDLADLELAYAPPFGSAKDPVNLAGMVATNLLAGDFAVWHGRDLPTAFAGNNGAGDDGAPELLDVRSAKEFTNGHLPGALNIAHTQLRDRIGEVPAGRPVLVYCASGFRSYLALRVLRQNGFDDVRSLSGGIKTFQLERPDLELETAPQL
jgi:NADPH-dependent 2,4-dienoyl-CoA reductase/sulfur reductase-like enzyme/rhodanese-related sulfurtransferase